MYFRLIRVALVFIIAAGAAGCGNGDNETKTETAASAQPQARQADNPGGYPAPRWPSYFKTPNSVEDLMGAARSLVRNTSGFQGKGMGILKEGESVLIVANTSTDPMVLEAIKRALVERKITPHIKYSYEWLNQSPDESKRRQTAVRQGRDITNAGIYQASSWIQGQFPDPAVPKKWLRERRPDLYKELFPGEAECPPAGCERRRQRTRIRKPGCRAAIRANASSSATASRRS